MRCHVAPVDFMEDDKEEEEKTCDARTHGIGWLLTTASPSSRSEGRSRPERYLRYPVSRVNTRVMNMIMFMAN